MHQTLTPSQTIVYERAMQLATVRATMATDWEYAHPPAAAQAQVNGPTMDMTPTPVSDYWHMFIAGLRDRINEEFFDSHVTQYEHRAMEDEKAGFAGYRAGFELLEQPYPLEARLCPPVIVGLHSEPITWRSINTAFMDGFEKSTKGFIVNAALSGNELQSESFLTYDQAIIRALRLKGSDYEPVIITNLETYKRQRIGGTVDLPSDQR
jgi:hypothetical protein